MRIGTKQGNWAAAAVSVVGIAVVLAGCGGGGGGGSSSGGLDGRLLAVVGTPGNLALSPKDANSRNGTNPPPAFAPTVTTENHWFRVVFPFPVDRNSILSNSPLLKPFSYLNGNITITDATGAHVPGLALVNGVDAQGNDRSNEIPHDLDPTGKDRNLGPGTFLYVADADGDLATKAPFGGYAPDPGNPNNLLEQATSTIDTVRVTVGDVNGEPIDAAWAFTISATTDTRPPFLVSLSSEVRDPTDPLNPSSIASSGSVIARFSEPMVPQSVGHSAELNGFPFDANLPSPVAPPPPFPHTTITATITTAAGPLFIPFDCSPLNVNNLTTYRLRPLLNLPPGQSIDAVVRALSTNGTAPIDLSGNSFDGPDLDNNGTPDGTDQAASFSVGPGPAVVNIPVSPEVIYWTPSQGDGIGAIDLNGWGFTTNTPGANAGIRERAPIITKVWLDQSGCELNPGGLNLTSGIGLWAHPNLATPTDPCTLQPMLEFPHNRYWYPIGTGSYPYGPVANLTNGERPWEFPNDPGNPGTPVPGVNEGSSGFETLCRDSNGQVILTGSDFGTVGNVQDLIVGEFLDRVFFDTKNFKASNTFHVTIFGGGAGTRGRNTIADPPVPNPPPTRYWVGLPQIDVNLNQDDPTNPALVIEGEEPFTNPMAGAANGYVRLRANTINENSVDQTVFPHFRTGPAEQSATQVFTFSTRQQLGNFLYVTDASSREVHAINSNTMRIVSSLSLPDPTGLAIAPDMKYLYVSNFSNDTFSVVGADPTAPNFHQEIARVATGGSGPRSIAIQPEAEDLLVCNFNSNTVTIIETKTLAPRKILDALIDGPFDVEVSERQGVSTGPHPFGWACGLYFAYISNFTGNTVVVYESGPDGAQGIGINNIRGALPTDDSPEELIAPRGICFSPLANPGGLFAGGIFVAHQDTQGFGRVSHIQFTQQAVYGPLPIVPPPGFFIPPGFTDRVFEIVATWGNTDSSRLAGNSPTDVVLCDLTTSVYQGNPAGAPNFGGVNEPPKPELTGFVNSKNHTRLAPNGQSTIISPDRLYVAFEDSDVIQVLDPNQAGVVVNQIEGHARGGTKRLTSYWRQ